MPLPSRRTVLSIIRTVVYAALAIGLALWRGEIKGLGDAALAGAIFGDYMTWVVWTVIELPEYLFHGCYEACVNLVFGVLLFRMGNMTLAADVTGELMAVMFLAGLLVAGIKIFGYGMIFIEEEIEDDD
jgi:hypothetical protein